MSPTDATSPSGATAPGDTASPGDTISRTQPQIMLRPVAVLLPPDAAAIPGGLPNEHFGSDHCSIVSVFELGPSVP